MKKTLFEMEPAFEEGWNSDNIKKKQTRTSPETKEPGRHRLYCSKETRRGKAVTIVKPFYLDKQSLQALLKSLKKKLGTGGTIKENALEFQGDIAERIQTELQQEQFGFRK